MNHPLTDDMCESIMRKSFLKRRNLRDAYDLAIEHLSQWIEEEGYEYVTDDFMDKFKKAMRPQEND